MPSRYSLVLFIGALLGLIVGLPLLVSRLEYTHAKRLRAVVAGKVFRSGQLTTEGFAQVVRKHGIRTIVNLQNDKLDPRVEHGYFDRRTVRESEVCKQLGIRYIALSPDLLFPREADHGKRPTVIDDFLEVMDDPTIYPVLFHCKAGLHRTGILAAVYRMEYQGWSQFDAYEELKAHGFGDRACTSANEYIRQYVLHYRPGQRRSLPTTSDRR